MTPFTFEARTRIVSGPGSVRRLGSIAAAEGAHRALIVSETGIIRAGHTASAVRSLESAGIEAVVFSQFGENPTSADADAARRFAEDAGGRFDLVVGVGGGSSMDLAKAANFLISNGGSMVDYWGYGNAQRPLLPMIGIPTTTGTGSEAQSYAVIADAATRRKMACGDPSAACRVAILDPELAFTQPFGVRAAAGFDAVAHAVETWVTAKRNAMSELLSREAWRLISSNYTQILEHPNDLEAIASMQWGAFLAGWAIEHSMLGAAHACANPLTQRYGTTHGLALAVLLPHVVRFNCKAARERYTEMGEALPARLREWADLGRLPATLRDVGVAEADLPVLADAAAEQWTGRYNPRPFDRESALEIYRCAY